MNKSVRAIPISVVEDDPAVLGSLCALLGAHGYVTAPYHSANQFLAEHDPTVPTCILLDLRLPGMSGIELQAHLNETGSRHAIVVVTAHGDVPVAVQAMRAGAIDFIEKPSEPERILKAIELAENSMTNVPSIALPKQVLAERLAKLTDREKEVLDFLLLGKLNKEIADELGVSRRTVEVHRSRIREKMQARGIADLIRMCG